MKRTVREAVNVVSLPLPRCLPTYGLGCWGQAANTPLSQPQPLPLFVTPPLPLSLPPTLSLGEDRFDEGGRPGFRGIGGTESMHSPGYEVPLPRLKMPKQRMATPDEEMR